MSKMAAIENWVERGLRRGVELAAMAYRHDGSSLSVKLRNISYDGCQLEAESVLSIGEKITLALPRMGEIKAQVRWATADGMAGARFVIDEVLAQQPCSASGL